jgi:hypothetical protein
MIQQVRYSLTDLMLRYTKKCYVWLKTKIHFRKGTIDVSTT